VNGANEVPGTPPNGDGEFEDDPMNEEGPVCQDPKAVVPDGWTKIVRDFGTAAVPPDARAKLVSPEPVPHIWIISEGAKQIGNLQFGVIEGLTTLDQAEELRKKDFGGTMKITRSTHECREDLVAVLSSQDGTFEVHHVVSSAGEVVVFACALPNTMSDVCTKFFASVHVD
jgi:hypothetical protein